MRFRKAMVILLVTGLMFAATSSVALGAEGEAELAGRGWLACRGRGLAELDMGGTLRLQIDGSVKIRDIAGDARVYINDRDDRAATTEIVLDDFEGGIKVTGTHFVVVARGTMRFLAVGHGFANLDGVGICKHGPHRPWHRWSAEVEV